jgi:hypothetical protein
MDLPDILGVITGVKGVVETLRSAKELLPASKTKDEIESKLAEAEIALKKSDARLAKELGYELCQCTFPPSIMLWKEREKAHVCQNPECQRKIGQTWARPYLGSSANNRD